MKYYSAREAAKILGVAHTTVIRWIEKGELKMKNEKNNSQLSNLNSQFKKPQLRFPELRGNGLRKDLMK